MCRHWLTFFPTTLHLARKRLKKFFSVCTTFKAARPVVKLFKLVVFVTHAAGGAPRKKVVD